MKKLTFRASWGKAFTLLLAGLVVGCDHNKATTVPVNLDYARTNLGYRNSGLLEAGSMFFWDMQENELVSLYSGVPLSERKAPNTTSASLRVI